MTFRTHLQRLELSTHLDRSCPACRDRRGVFTLVIREPLADGTVTEPEGMPVPCVQYGQIPERVIEIVEEIVESPGARDENAEGLQASESVREVIGGGPDIA